MADVFPPLIPAPTNSGEWEAWRHSLEEWRTKSPSQALGDLYRRPEFAWLSECHVCGLAMLFDRELYDEDGDRFRVAEYVERNRREFGALDAVLLWQAYPRIGIDSRNQYDHYRLAPNLKTAVEQFHQLGVRVFMAYNPWDSGTRREGTSDSAAIASVVGEFGFDGVFLDTLKEGTPALRNALDLVRPGLALESEDELPVPAMADNQASWAQWFDDAEAPGVLRNRWLERRHVMHVIRRWDIDHTGELHMAWMNGAGVLVWENVFGSWNGWSDRDKAILRSMAPIRRRYRALFDDGEWTPLVPCTLDGAYGSRWTLGGSTLWTIVNRRWDRVHGSAFPLSADGSVRLFDLVRGKELDHAELEIAGRWIGAVLSVPTGQADEGLLEFLKAQAKAYQPDAAALGRIEPAASRIVPKPVHRLHAPEGFAVVKGRESTQVSRFRARECGEYGGAPFPNFSYPPLHFERHIEQRVSVTPFAISRHEITNREFLAFIGATRYRPRVADSFLAHWLNGLPRSEEMDKPVTFVSLEDARAYALWGGLRLPTEIEWQIGVVEHRLIVGEVWNWTESEHFDGHTRFSILKGGSQFRAEGSDWYADSGPQAADWSAKYIHFYPALDRSESVGFRCAVDLPTGS